MNKQIAFNQPQLSTLNYLTKFITAMNRKSFLLFTCMTSSFFSSAIYAKTLYCKTDTGNPFTYQYNFNFGSDQNFVGHTTNWKELRATGNYYVRGECQPANTTFWSARSASGVTAAFTESNGTVWHDIPNNDYIQVASQIFIWNRINGGGFNHVPFSNRSNDCAGRCAVAPAASGGRSQVNLRIKKRFIGSSFIVSQPIAYLYATQGTAGGVGTTPMVILNLTAEMTVPQKCDINAGQVINIDFGNLSTQVFKDTAVGRKPELAPIRERTFSIQCNNVDAAALLSVRIETSSAQNNIILSNNPDVGFILADQNNNELQPNNINSHIPFKLQSNSNPRADIAIKSWPVSSTGKTPKAGNVKANGYLRVDFK